jgi:PadR family transcriptional regulator, regulatory protein PadR
MTMRADALKGHLDGLLLAVVAEEPAHGYAIVERLRRRSHGAFDLPEGTVYPALHRLEQAGLLKSSWAPGTTRRRRVYALTAKGRSKLGERRAEWGTFSRAIDSVLKELPA